ncbi:hypothetical protein [Pedobacter sp. MW01-1-1]|uniref:hypothetical protein n=1 Tax=Pedobacter sp. MW01-1-1 TaxID=3383027 RepID=UPI003FF09F69
MKKLVLLLLVLGTISCNAYQYFEPKYTMGMQEQEFAKLNRDAIKVFGDESDVVIYRTINEATKQFKFFVFSKQKLIRFEESSQPDGYKWIQLSK